MVARNIYNIIRVLGPFSREIERESDRREGGGKTELGMGRGEAPSASADSSPPQVAFKPD